MLKEKSTAIWSFTKCDFKVYLWKFEIQTDIKRASDVRSSKKKYQPYYFFAIYAKKYHALP